MLRRDFLYSTAVAGSTIGASLANAAESSTADLPTPPTEGAEGEMKYRTLGNTKERVSLLGVGGFHIGVPQDEKVGIAIIQAAMDAGINFLDNSWDYHNGGSEMRMGKALADGRRDKAFLMTKIDGRTKASAMQQLEQSLQRLQTDRIDLVQHHEVIRFEDPDRIFAEDGAMAALLEAKKAGKLRYIGFTGHKDPAVHLRTLEIAKAKGHTIDTVQMPLNILDAHFRSFRGNVLPVLVQEGIGVLGMKPLASSHALRTKAVTPQECLHFAMTLPTSVVISGMESMDVLNQNLAIVRSFKPVDPQTMTALLEKTSSFAATGEYEPFKTSAQFDATAKNPEWLG